MRSSFDAIEALRARVVIITFGTEYWIKVWLQETGAPFTTLVDQERAAYRAFGLERSIIRSWGIKTIWRYGRLLRSGRRWRGIRGDSGQLGGDFIVDRTGVLQYTHPSRDPTDRPSAAQLLDVLRRL